MQPRSERVVQSKNVKSSGCDQEGRAFIPLHTPSPEPNTGGLQKGLLNPTGACASNFYRKRNHKVLDGDWETWDRLLSLGEPTKSPQLVLQKGWLCLHPYFACYSVPIKRAPLSDAKQAQCPGAGSGHAGSSASEETQKGR